MKKGLFILVQIILTLSACSPLGQQSGAGTSPLGADAAAMGADLFNTNCAVCHGPEGHGDGPAADTLDPRPKNLAELAPAISDNDLFFRITVGKPGTAMVAWKDVLTDEQIWQIIAYVRTLK